jgi:hypothetical protein
MVKQKICLNMIVKNEAHVIKDTLENILKYIPISYYVISDTGSNDGTQDIIKNFFDSKNINGEIFNDQWKDFGHNRSLALQYAFNKADYLFIFDADDRIYGNFILPEKLTEDSYHLKFGNSLIYKRLSIVKGSLKWKYNGVLHEYITCISKSPFTEFIIDGDYYIESGKTGSRSQDPDKYKKDALLLENAFYEAEKNNEHIKIRYSFYCAQSYRDCGDKINSIKWYLIRANLKDWNQEVYYSYLMVGNLYHELNEFEKAIYYWMLAFEADPERYENIYEIISYFRKKNLFDIAFKFYLMISNKNIDFSNKLFLYHNVYDYLLDYEMIFVFYYQKKYNEGFQLIYKILNKNIPYNISLNIIEIIVFYLDYIPFDLNFNLLYCNFIKKTYSNKRFFNDLHIQKINKTILKLTDLYSNFNYKDIIQKLVKKNQSNKNINKKIKVFLSITSCKRYDLFEKTINSLLICFKDIHLIDYFFCVDDNSSNDDRNIMIKKYPFFKFYLKKENQKGHLHSMNIIFNKLVELKPKYWIHLEDDWLFFKPFEYVQNSINFLEKYKNNNIHQILFNKNYAETISCYNLVGGKILDNQFLEHIKDEPNLSGINCAYWPHYSFRPSMILVDTIIKLGNFNSEYTFFEMDYANKYFNSGFKSAFYDEISCIHIGKLTSEKVSLKKNAYALNDVKQFDNSNIINNNHKVSFIITLSMNKVSLTNININYYIKKIFKNNNFNNNKNIILNNITHINIWEKILNNNFNYTFISDYDIPFDYNIFDDILNHNIDILLIKNTFDTNYVINDLNNISISFFKNINDNINLYSYIINKNFIIKTLKYINSNGITQKNLLNIITNIDDLNIYVTNDILIKLDKNKLSDYDETTNEFFDLTMDKNEYLFIKNKDHYGDDICFKSNFSIEQLKNELENLDDAIAFNNLGYIKNFVDINNLIKIDFGNINDGLYIHVNKYNKKYPYNQI